MSALALLSVFAVALHGSRRQLLCVIGGLLLVFIGPVVLIGGDAYPLSGLRSALLLGSIATIVGFAIQDLLASLREREAEREQLLGRLREQASTDELTGLANLRAWNRRLDAALAQAARSGEPLAVALLDLDHFKRINDTQGHAAVWAAPETGQDLVQRADAALYEAKAAGRARVRDAVSEDALASAGLR